MTRRRGWCTSGVPVSYWVEKINARWIRSRSVQLGTATAIEWLSRAQLLALFDLYDATVVNGDSNRTVTDAGYGFGEQLFELAGTRIAGAAHGLDLPG